MSTHLTPHPLTIAGLNRPLQLWLHDTRDQHVSRDIAANGIWEAYETHLVIERLKPGDCFVDVGANIGYYTAIAADRLGDSGYIVAFEPDPDNVKLLQQNMRENGFDRIDIVAAGLSDNHRSAALFRSTTNFGDHQIYDNGDGRKSCPIDLVNGTEYLRGKVAEINLLKIDTQGAESQVIAGLLPLLKQSGRQLSIIIEFWPYGLRKAGSSGYELLDMLAELELPFKIIDHVGHDLLDCTEQQLREWVEMVESNPDDQGFMNIMLGD
jgi:FkbM family methyltransferase|tara:strand:+ start:4844 stop:5644 length:801 start_codon:yes stop_codon:yes gene_type:complete